MRQSTFLRCRKCGCHFILTLKEFDALSQQGEPELPTKCHYCRNEERLLLYAAARQNPDKLFRYRCSICHRTFVSVRSISPVEQPLCICPVCMPDCIPVYTDEDRQLNKDLGYPR